MEGLSFDKDTQSNLYKVADGDEDIHIHDDQSFQSAVALLLEKHLWEIHIRLVFNHEDDKHDEGGIGTKRKGKDKVSAVGKRSRVAVT